MSIRADELRDQERYIEAYNAYTQERKGDSEHLEGYILQQAGICLREASQDHRQAPATSARMMIEAAHLLNQAAERYQAAGLPLKMVGAQCDLALIEALLGETGKSIDQICDRITTLNSIIPEPDVLYQLGLAYQLSGRIFASRPTTADQAYAAFSTSASQFRASAYTMREHDLCNTYLHWAHTADTLRDRPTRQRVARSAVASARKEGDTWHMLRARAIFIGGLRGSRLLFKLCRPTYKPDDPAAHSYQE